jgi:deoxycytidine triphosphate deaminase
MLSDHFVDLFGCDSHNTQNVAHILSDKQIKPLLQEVIIGADEDLISPNGIELRLGGLVRFLSTNEKKVIAPGHFLVIHPGEAVLIVSIERLNFKKEIVQKYFKNGMLMAIITPTTTMMREGMLQCATKVHTGFCGDLNWGFRNSSSKDFTIKYGEPIFNLTLFLLEGNEIPEIAYGDRGEHRYQNSSGIMSSQRKIEADIPPEKIVMSSFHKLDPKTQLQEAGHPFNYIGSELTILDGKFVSVSAGVDGLKTQIRESDKALRDHINTVFQSKFLWAASLCTGFISAVYTVLGLLRQQPNVNPSTIYIITGCLAVLVPLFGWILFFKRNN